MSDQQTLAEWDDQWSETELGRAFYKALTSYGLAARMEARLNHDVPNELAIIRQNWEHVLYHKRSFLELLRHALQERPLA